MTVTPVRYGRLSRAARDTIRFWYGKPVTIAGYVRYWYADGVWRGDACGCHDDRCVGYHHGADQDCGCIEAMLGEYTTVAIALALR